MNLVYSILLSIHDRDPIDLQHTLKQLAKAVAPRQPDEVEFCIVFDFAPGAQPDMEAIIERFAEAMPHEVKIEHYDTIALHPETFHLHGHNNPVAVNNKLMDMAKGTNLVWVSSDVLVNPFLLDRIDAHLEDGALDTVYCARVLDLDTASEFCGPSRPFPMMWCIAHPHTGERHDLQLLKGFGFDDNDWVARMALKTGSVTIDVCNLVLHQTHGRVSQLGQLASGKAYSEEAKPGWEASTKYIQEKWGGVPFDGKTLKIEYNQIGEFIVLNVNGRRDGK